MKYTELYFKIQIIGGVICFGIVASVFLYYFIGGRIQRIKNRRKHKIKNRS